MSSALAGEQKLDLSDQKLTRWADPNWVPPTPGTIVQSHDPRDRVFEGAAASSLFTSREEAPEVATYNYDEVNVTAFEDGSTNLNDFNSQWTSTLFGGIGSNALMPNQVPPDVLLADALMCIRIDDGVRLGAILKQVQEMGHPYPADVEFGELYPTTLWQSANDPELQIPDQRREDAIALLSYFHAPPAQ